VLHIYIYDISSLRVNYGSEISGVIMFCSNNIYCLCVNMVYRLVMHCSEYGFYVDVAAELW